MPRIGSNDPEKQRRAAAARARTATPEAKFEEGIRNFMYRIKNGTTPNIKCMKKYHITLSEVNEMRAEAGFEPLQPNMINGYIKEKLKIQNDLRLKTLTEDNIENDIMSHLPVSQSQAPIRTCRQINNGFLYIASGFTNLYVPKLFKVGFSTNLEKRLHHYRKVHPDVLFVASKKISETHAFDISMAEDRNHLKEVEQEFIQMLRLDFDFKEYKGIHGIAKEWFIGDIEKASQMLDTFQPQKALILDSVAESFNKLRLFTS
jgi:hypothetical protein